MPVYHQMGHQSKNLLFESSLKNYAGAILSPVNSDQDKMAELAREYRDAGNYELIFDPQLYYPKCEIPKLRSWSYFPDTFATIDAASDKWWRQLASDIASVLERIQPNAVCSPAFVPRTYPNSYFSEMTKIAGIMYDAVAHLNIDVLQTVLVDLSELTNSSRVHSIASILTQTKAKRLYLVFVGDLEPRRESGDTESLKGAMRLINILEENELKILVGFCSSDIILWKAAGASSCATGKFWNLRRFTPSRWSPEDGGGGQLAYWFEESLLASLRAPDVIRIGRANMISPTSSSNPYCEDILEKIHDGRGKAWVGLGWRQYLYWFYDIETRISKSQVNVSRLLRIAENNWEITEDQDLLMDESRNDGRWIRPWRQALAEFQQV